MRVDTSPEPLLRWLDAVFVHTVRQRHDDLTMRQLAVMMITYLEEDAQTVRGLASSLHISRPAVSRALDRLGESGLIRRQVDPRDRRSVVVRRTRKGIQRMHELRSLMVDCVDKLPSVSEATHCPPSHNNGLVGAHPHADDEGLAGSGGLRRL